MKQVININFQGRVVPIEVSAYELLKQYIDSLARHFAAEEGKDEIINDIENRIGELFQERIRQGASCITDDDVQAVVASIGRPEDFDGEAKTGEPAADTQTAGPATDRTGRKRLYRDENHKLVGGVCSGIANYFNVDIVVVRIVFLILLFSFGFGFVPYIILWIAVPAGDTTTIGSRRRKMYRDPDDKWIGGVCSGIANYFDVSPWIPRFIFAVPFLSFAFNVGHWSHFDFPGFVRLGFSPGSLFIYIILWLVLPEAVTTAEKLEMKGEKVDINSIKNSVLEEMRGVQERAQKFGKEAAAFANERGKTFSAESSAVVRRTGRSFGDIIIFLIKLFGYFILGTVCLALVVALFAFGIAAIGVFPMKDFVLSSGTQNGLAWGTLIFFVLVPMIGVITWIIRKIAKVRAGSKLLRFGFIALWIAGWVFFICLLSSVSRDFRAQADVDEQEIALANPTVPSLEITAIPPGLHYSRSRNFRLDPFDGVDEDSALVRNVSINIVRSLNDSFKVTVIKLACGRNKRSADTLAALIPFHALQQDSLLVIDRALPINKKDKFRNQKVILTVYVPVGHRIMINRNVGWSNDVRLITPWGSGSWDNIEEEGDRENGWDEGHWYSMTEKGLYTQDGKPVHHYNGDDENSENSDDDVNRRTDTAHISTDKATGTYRYHATKDSTAAPINVPVKPDTLQPDKNKAKQLLKHSGPAAANTYTSLPARDPIDFMKG